MLRGRGGLLSGLPCLLEEAMNSIVNNVENEACGITHVLRASTSKYLAVNCYSIRVGLNDSCPRWPRHWSGFGALAANPRTIEKRRFRRKLFPPSMIGRLRLPESGYQKYSDSGIGRQRLAFQNGNRACTNSSGLAAKLAHQKLHADSFAGSAEE